MGVLSDPRKTCLYVSYTRLCCGAAIDIRKMSMGAVVIIIIIIITLFSEGDI